MKKITFIDETNTYGKTVLLRADFDVSLRQNATIADDRRIKSNIPTIKHLLSRKNRIICIAKLGRPTGHDKKLSLQIILSRLSHYLPDASIKLIPDFLTENPETFSKQKENEILVLENIRFYPEEKRNDAGFAKKLARLGDIYVNDSFAMCHRLEASVVGIPKLLPSYGGLLLKDEIKYISKSIKKPSRPLVAIIGGSKINTKITLIEKLIENADIVLIGGSLANVFFAAQGMRVANGEFKKEYIKKARELLFLASQKQTAVILPVDVLTGNPTDTVTAGTVIRLNGGLHTNGRSVLDIGPETKARFAKEILLAKTIIWNGPVGMFENPCYSQGTDFLYYTIAQNMKATSIIGGGDTLSAINNKEYLKRISHISTGGGAMLEFIEKGTLPGIEALKTGRDLS